MLAGPLTVKVGNWSVTVNGVHKGNEHLAKVVAAVAYAAREKRRSAVAERRVAIYHGPVQPQTESPRDIRKARAAYYAMMMRQRSRRSSKVFHCSASQGARKSLFEQMTARKAVRNPAAICSIALVSVVDKI